MIQSAVRKKKPVQRLIQKLDTAIELHQKLKSLNMFITSTFESAKAELHHETLSGPLNGLTLAVKDCYSMKGILTTCGSRVLQHYIPPYTATVVDKLLRSGATFVGKTNLDEFCMGASSTQSAFGPTKNPWTLKLWKDETNLDSKLNKDWILAGGSSGGSAAAVAAGLADIALGSDTGGSTRNPASFCGIVGFKPSYGLMSRYGMIPLTNSLDVPGIMAKNVDHIALALDVAAGYDLKDSTSIQRFDSSFVVKDKSDVKGLVIGIPEEYNMPNLSLSVQQWWQNIAFLLEKSGCKLKVVSLPHTRYSIICYHVLGECEIASNMARYDGIQYGYRSDDNACLTSLLSSSRHQAFNEVVRRRILVGNYFLLRKNYFDYYLKSLKVRRLIANDFDRIFKSMTKPVDVLLCPVTLSEAPLYSEWKSDDQGYKRERSDDYLTQPANMAGIPAISLPVGLANNGLPIGLQLMADYGCDKKLLRLAKFIEKRVEFKGLDLQL